MMKTVVALSCLIASVAFAQQGARQYVDCSCSPSKRGYGNGARDQVRDDIKKMREYEAMLKLDAKTDPTLTPQKIREMVQTRANEKWTACVNNQTYEECVNADTAFRRPAGRTSDSFCRYNAAWQNVKGGMAQPSCDKNPATAATDQTITEGNPDQVSATPPPAPPARPAPATPNRPARPAPAAPAKPAAPAAPAAPAPTAPTPAANGKVPPPAPAAPAPATGNTKPAATAVPPGRPDVPASQKPPVQTPPPGTAPASQPASSDDAEASTINNEEFPPVNVSTPEPASQEEAVCFPASATVQLEDGSIKTMADVELGDKVLVSSAKYSEVFMYTHKMEDVRHNFVTLKTSTMELSLTRSHYLYVNGNLVPAGTAKVGDTLESASGEPIIIESITSKVMEGLYNPQTVHGDIIVDNVRASTYTAVAQPSAAHAMLAPIRSLFTRFGGITTAMLDSGCDVLAKGVSAIVA